MTAARGTGVAVAGTRVSVAVGGAAVGGAVVGEGAAVAIEGAGGVVGVAAAVGWTPGVAVAAAGVTSSSSPSPHAARTASVRADSAIIVALVVLTCLRSSKSPGHPLVGVTHHAGQR